MQDSTLIWSPVCGGCICKVCNESVGPDRNGEMGKHNLTIHFLRWERISEAMGREASLLQSAFDLVVVGAVLL